jgi:hypothetical protein
MLLFSKSRSPSTNLFGLLDSEDDKIGAFETSASLYPDKTQ